MCRRPQLHPASRQAFTLVELLVVVAIVAILALIAVPNLLESQARAKVAREVADMRSLATALEAYAADHSAYPPHGEILSDGTVNFPAVRAGIATIEFAPGWPLTTPVAYLAALAEDICLLKKQEPLERRYGYLSTRLMADIMLRRGWADSAAALPGLYGAWRLYAAGPDGDKGIDTKHNIPYDPTNGTLSDGDLMRSQLRPWDKSADDESS
jgi:prepilin-type N-terminal cleavage/methylation domain-containing protein